MHVLCILCTIGARYAAVQAALASRGSQEDDAPMSSRRPTMPMVVPTPSNSLDENVSLSSGVTSGGSRQRPVMMYTDVHVYLFHVAEVHYFSSCILLLNILLQNCICNMSVHTCIHVCIKGKVVIHSHSI